MPRALLICDSGKIGTIKQAQALAEEMGCDHELYEIRSSLSWLVAPWLKPSAHPKKISCVISAGRRAAPVALALKRDPAYKSIPFIHIMDPGWLWRARFDAVIVPGHDKLEGINIISVLGALAKPAKPDEDVVVRYQKYVPSHKPTLVVLIGGDTPNYKFTKAAVEAWCTQLTECFERTPMNVLLSFSRRTSKEVRDSVSAKAIDWGAYIWNEQPPNPYPFFLSRGDVFLISQDSISMVSEAATTGKPVYLLPLKSKPSKFDSFYEELITKNHALWFDGELSIKPPAHRLDALKDAVTQLKERGVL